jgi:hypothetical protein
MVKRTKVNWPGVCQKVPSCVDDQLVLLLRLNKARIRLLFASAGPLWQVIFVSVFTLAIVDLHQGQGLLFKLVASTS